MKLTSLTSVQLGYWLIAAVHLAVMSAALIHALIHKRDYRAALGWVGVIIVFPVAGPLLYFIFGINRVRTRAKIFAGHHLPSLDFRNRFARRLRRDGAANDPAGLPVPWLGDVGGQVTNARLIPGNNVEVLVNGEAFYPRLIDSLDRANDYILLSSYIFSNHGISAKVVDALCRAVTRNVRVYVLIDGIGLWYSLRHATRPLKKAGARVALFMPPSLIPPSVGINLRNHRKITVIDGEKGFFGGMNIDGRHMVDDPGNRHPTRDVHFEIDGPAVTALQQSFAGDWWMMTGEALEFLSETTANHGDTPCRVINDGPDETLDYLAMTLIGIFSAAREDITIMVPYFLPSRAMIGALQAAAIRGVRVRIVLPEKSNLPYIDWATRKMLWELLIWDVEIRVIPPPFDHAKLIVIDHCYVMGGSANLDPRSLRLNFELGVEMFSPELAATITQHIEQSLLNSHPVTLHELDQRSIWLRIRDAFVWLFSGYL